MSLRDVLALFSGLALLSLCLYLRKRHHTLPLPPGPKKLPLIGNLFDLPRKDEYLTYAQWGKEYGDVVSLEVLGNSIIVLNSAKAAQDLLGLRSAIYSDRPYIPMVHDPSLIGLDNSVPLRRYGPEWRCERRLFLQHLNRTASRAYHGKLTVAAHSLLRSLLRDPKQYFAHLRHAASASYLGITYGYQVQEESDPLVAASVQAIDLVANAILPGKYLVNIFPWLKYVPSFLPGAGFKKYAAMTREIVHQSSVIPFEDARKRTDDGTASLSLVTSVLADNPTSETITTARNVASTMFGAGADTTIATMHACILALVLYPEVQLRAQAELDRVIGSPSSPTFRLPTFADRPQVPYIDAIIKECLRWFPIAPTGVPHTSIEDDEYRGWRIPKGSVVIYNAWQMLLDEKVYPDPRTFRPERFLGDKPAPTPSSQGCFGFGRRECPGRYIGDASLWIQIASILAAFTISPAMDNEGRPIDVNYAYHPASRLVLHPQDFPCSIKPRSMETEAQIRNIE